MNRISLKDSKAKEKPTDPLTVPKGIDGSTMFAPSIPESVLMTVPLLHAMSIDDAATLLDISMGVATNASGAYTDKIVKNETSRHIADDTFATVVSGLYAVVKTAIRTKVHASALTDNLLKMHFPAPFVTSKLVPAIINQRAELESTALLNRVRFPTVNKLRWRVDVTISSGLLSRVMRPNLLMQASVHILNNNFAVPVNLCAANSETGIRYPEKLCQRIHFVISLLYMLYFPPLTLFQFNLLLLVDDP